MITPQTNTTLEEMAQKIKSLHSFVICGHVSPDGDCIGSQLALYHALGAMGKEAVCLLAKRDSVDAGLAFLPGIADMVAASDYRGEAEVFIACDTPTHERLGDCAAIKERCPHSITIDHHAVDTSMSELTYVDPDVASTTMIIWELIGKLAIEPSADMALCAYTGLVTDTGGFQFQNTNREVFVSASEMLNYSIDPSEVARNIFQNRSLASLRLEGLALERLAISHNNRYCLSYLRQEDMRKFNATKADAEPLINVLRSLDRISVACMLREEASSVRGSLRAKDHTDVSKIARSLGGGGHKAAAGFTLELSLDEAIIKMTDILDNCLEG